MEIDEVAVLLMLYEFPLEIYDRLSFIAVFRNVVHHRKEKGAKVYK
jgi:hypothetical protein